MDLANTTPMTTKLLLGQPHDPELLSGCLLAKATYRFDQQGELLMDLERPEPVLTMDRPTALGLLPREDLIFCRDHLEVILLGSAVAPGGARELAVSLGVGNHVRALQVTGDRCWDASSDASTRAEPFTTMPLTWERAFGGQQEVWLTQDTAVDVAHPLNPAGKGFDPRPQARGLCQGVYTANGFPRWEQRRALPNVEDPEHAVRAPADDPLPCCWAPAPLNSPLFLARLGGVIDADAAPARPPDPSALAARSLDPEVLHRAHPTWVIPPIAPGAAVRMEGLTPWGRAAFSLPRPRLTCDWRLGPKVGQRAMHLARLVLLPDEARFYLVYFCRFTYRRNEGETRALRLRLES